MSDAGQLESYIPGRIERLRRQKATATSLCVGGGLIAVAMPLVSLRMLPEAIILASVIWIGTRLMKAVADIHVDMLCGQWRDMDRDFENGLHGFETRVPFT